jgi:hypothetical protein
MKMATKIQGIDGMSDAEIIAEVDQGARFVYYQYCVSIIILTFRRSSDIYFIRADEGRVTKGLPWTILSAVVGWWGIPWGPIYTIGALFKNLRGGIDVTDQIVNRSANDVDEQYQVPEPA